ncbi:MAG: DNA polymerase III subunit delta [Candidatus Celerinatantimonas neptuna]|nr:MAG: DNA polymerase III subunit delta [Candidatus Celerinatantimonas neptuna]
MKIYADQLPRNLHKIMPVYLVTGDEPLIRDESVSMIRQKVMESGQVERLFFHKDSDFQWQQLTDQTRELSLFSPLKLLELSFSGAPDKTDQQELENLLPQIPADICLLLSMPQLKKTQQKKSWYQHIEQHGIVVQVFEPQGKQFQQWIKQRLRAYQLKPEEPLAERLSYFYEGNLFALNQTIERLHLAYPDGNTRLDEVEATLMESGQFNQYQLVDAIWEDNLPRALQITRMLRQKNEDLTLFNWSINRDLQVLTALKQEQENKELWQQFKIWPKRQPLLRQVAHRLSSIQLHQARMQLAQLDLAIKSSEPAVCWQQFEQLLLIFSTQQWSFNHV